MRNSMQRSPASTSAGNRVDVAVDKRRPGGLRQPPVFSLDSGITMRRVPGEGLRLQWGANRVYQVVLVSGGHSREPIGHSVVPMRSGDLFLLGLLMPHIRTEGLDSHAAHRRGPGGRSGPVAAVVQFGDGFLGRGFLELPESRGVARLLERSGRGLVFPSAVRRRVGEAILGLGRLSGLRRTLALAEILQVLAESPAEAISTLAVADTEGARRDDDRLERVVRLIHEGLPAPIRRGKLATAVGVSERSLSRMIRRRFGKTLPQLVNHLRVGQARDLLLETTHPVTRIAEDCGFQNLSNFNVQFQRLCGSSPQAFRRVARGPQTHRMPRTGRRKAGGGSGRKTRARRVRARASE